MSSMNAGWSSGRAFTSHLQAERRIHSCSFWLASNWPPHSRGSEVEARASDIQPSPQLRFDDQLSLAPCLLLSLARSLARSLLVLGKIQKPLLTLSEDTLHRTTHHCLTTPLHSTPLSVQKHPPTHTQQFSTCRNAQRDTTLHRNTPEHHTTRATCLPKALTSDAPLPTSTSMKMWWSTAADLAPGPATPAPTTTTKSSRILT